MSEGWLIPYLREASKVEDCEIYFDDVVKLVGWANSLAILLRQLDAGQKPSDPDMLKNVIETGVRIGILPVSHVKVTP